MPWKERSIVEERMRLVLRLKDGESMAWLCREFGISRVRAKTEGTALSEGFAPNALWCTDYKGEFMLGDKRYCYPLTVSDYASRYLLLCEAMESVKEQGAFTAFENMVL